MDRVRPLFGAEHHYADHIAAFHHGMCFTQIGGISAVEGVGEGAGDFAGIGNSIFCSASVCSIGSGRLKPTAYMFFSNKVSESVIMPSEIELNKNGLIFHIVT